MKAIQIKNIRSIEDSGRVEIKPITVVVGKNSCGKSSFIRIFPLLKQTMEKKVSEPILWYGDYVDYGDFNSVLMRDNAGESIEINLELSEFRPVYMRYNPPLKDLKISLVITEKYIEKIKIQFEDQIIEMFYKENNSIEKILINGEDNIINCNELIARKEYGEFIPVLLIREKDGINQFRYRRVGREAYNNIIKILKNISGNNTRIESIEETIRHKDFVGSSQELLEMFKGIKFSSTVLNRNLEKLEIESDIFKKLNNFCIGDSIFQIIDYVNRNLWDEINNINYIKPIRAMVDRFYRVQGINVEELDSDGSNLPMILHNMTKPVLKEFEQWCFDQFGTVFSVTDKGGHVSLVIKESFESKEMVNLADTGYGYSQILPIIVLLWMIRNKKNKRTIRTKTVVIEQPELHLHPALQAKLIDILINVINEAKKYNIDIKIIFETHSETIVNRIGYLIAKKYVNPELVNVLIFDKENSKTQIKTVKYKDNGALADWPVGFFTPDRLVDISK